MENSIVTAEELTAECLKLKYAELLRNRDVFPSKNNWEYICQHRMSELSSLLYQKFLIAENTPENQRIEFHKLAITHFPIFLQCIGYDDAVDTIYRDTTTNVTVTINIVIKANLFNVQGILSMLTAGQVCAAAKMLIAHKPSYSHRDLQEMKALLDAFRELPDAGYIETSKFIGTEKYICPNGHSNRFDAEFCSHKDCRLNIKGLTINEVNCITDFADRIDALEALLSRKALETNN